MTHETSHPNISVNIEIDGPVINSTIIGIDNQSKRIQNPVFSRVLSEYLVLPTLHELAARVHRAVNTTGKELRTFDFSKHGLEYLWQCLLQDQYWMAPPSNFTAYDSDDAVKQWFDQHGDHVKRGKGPDPILRNQWVILRNVQLSPFVNRSPGRFYRGGWEFTKGHSEFDDGRFLVSSRMWTWEDYAVRTMGIGDVRLPEQDGYYLMQATSALFTNSDLGIAFVDVMPDGSRYAGGSAISALGFPILVSETLYDRLNSFISSHGAVAVDKLTVRLVRAPEESRVLWAPGIPKTVLIASDARAATGVSTPMPAFNAAWTVAIDEDFSQAHYCTWGFQTGIRTFRSELEAAAKVISGAIKERGLRACFEFDHETNWFGESSIFTVSDISKLAATLPSLSPIRETAEEIDYAAQYDSWVERETGFSLEKRNPICLVIGEAETGRMQSAHHLLDSIDREVAEHPFVIDLKARLYWLSGDTRNAIKLWRNALDRQPQYDLRARITRSLRIAEAE